MTDRPVHLPSTGMDFTSRTNAASLVLHTLRAERGERAGERFALSLRTIIGRGGGVDIQLLSARVSRHHAVILLRDDGRCVLRDLSSANGTFVGNTRVQQLELERGADIVIGDACFVYEQQLCPVCENLAPRLMSGRAAAPTFTSKSSV